MTPFPKPSTRTFSLTVLLLLLSGLLLMYFLGMFSLIFFVAFAAIGATVFVAFNRTKTRRSSLIAPVPKDRYPGRNVARTLSILYFVCYGISYLVIASEMYAKPLAYYLLVSLCAALIAADIILIRKKLDVWANLAKSYLLALNIFLASQIIFPYGIGGADSITHLTNITLPIVDTGHMPMADFSYATFPIHHILVAQGSLILDVAPDLAYNMLGGVVISFGVLFAFLLGRFLFDRKSGLVAALLFSSCSYVIYWASHPAQITFVAPIVFALVLTVFFSYRRRHMGIKIVTPIMITFIVFSHPHSSVLALIMILSILVVQKLTTLRERQEGWSVSNLLLMFLAILLVHWMYYSLIFQTAVGFAESYITTILGESATAPQAVYDFYPISDIFLNTLGLCLLGMISVCGFLHIYSRMSFHRALIGGLAVALAAIAFIGQVFNLVFIIPHRVFFYMEAITLVFLAAAGIRYLGLDTLRKGLSIMRNVALIALVFLIFFFSTSSTISGFETSLYSADHPYVKLYETGYERQSIIWVEQHFSKEDYQLIYKSCSFSRNSIAYLLVDPQNEKLLFENIPLTETNDDVNYDLIENGSAILFSRYDISIGFQAGVAGRGRYGLGVYGRFDNLDLDHLDVLDRHFDNGNVIVFRDRNP